MKYWSSANVFKYSWDQVAIAFWNRYPNPHSSHVVSEDTLCRRISGDRIFTTRLLGKTTSGPLPRWGARLMGGRKTVYVVEESIVDLRSRTITTYTRNIGLAKIMQIEEKCVYRPEDGAAGTTMETRCDRRAWVSSQLRGFSYALERFGLERFRRNAGRAASGFNHILQKLYPAHATMPSVTAHHQGASLRRNTAKAKEIAKTRAAAVIATVKPTN